MTWNPFLLISDLRFWIRSARSDAHLQNLRREHDYARSLDLLYEDRKDPWGLDSPDFRYQQIKYAGMLSLLPSRRYKRALDLGCGLGRTAYATTPIMFWGWKCLALPLQRQSDKRRSRALRNSNKETRSTSAAI